MKNVEDVIAALNRAVKVEHTLMMQCQHQALTVRGLWRTQFQGFFRELSDEAREHAAKFGQKIVGLGGNPTTEVGAIRHASDVFEMLEADLELERQALSIYGEALSLAGDDVALRNMLEDHIEAETQHIEELELVASKQATTATLRKVS
ncbi:MAG: ferritin-like domain-containing protein [Myxococcota bacterium]